MDTIHTSPSNYVCIETYKCFRCDGRPVRVDLDGGECHDLLLCHCAESVSILGRQFGSLKVPHMRYCIWRRLFNSTVRHYPFICNAAQTLTMRASPLAGKLLIANNSLKLWPGVFLEAKLPD